MTQLYITDFTCMRRLNFVLFSIGQPDSESVCNTDTFDVAGASNKIPTICGDNDGQHSNSNFLFHEILYLFNCAISTLISKLIFQCI